MYVAYVLFMDGDIVLLGTVVSLVAVSATAHAKISGEQWIR
jgi:hypothetical protein